MATEEETAELKRLLNEAMDAGACGWSSQTLGQPGDPAAPTAGGAAQSDFDGTPMPSDVMWPETQIALAEVLGDRGEGFIELSGATMPREHWEQIAETSGAPIIYQALPASNITQVWLNNNNLTDAGVATLAAGLPDTKVTKFWMNGNAAVSDDGLRSIAEMLPKTEIDEFWCIVGAFGDEGVRAIAKALPQTKLETLWLWSTSMSWKSSDIDWTGLNIVESVSGSPVVARVVAWFTGSGLSSARASGSSSNF